MKRWNKTLFGLAGIGVTLYIAANISIMYAPNALLLKLAVAVCGILISALGMILQTFLWWRKRN